MIFKNSKLYDALKWIALVALDAIGVAYYGIAEVWNLPFGDEISKTCQIIAALLGVLIGVSSYKYNKTEIINDIEDDYLLDERDDEDYD